MPTMACTSAIRLSRYGLTHCGSEKKHAVAASPPWLSQAGPQISSWAAMLDRGADAQLRVVPAEAGLQVRPGTRRRARQRHGQHLTDQLGQRAAVRRVRHRQPVDEQSVPLIDRWSRQGRRDQPGFGPDAHHGPGIAWQARGDVIDPHAEGNADPRCRRDAARTSRRDAGRQAARHGRPPWSAKASRVSTQKSLRLTRPSPLAVGIQRTRTLDVEADQIGGKRANSAADLTPSRGADRPGGCSRAKGRARSQASSASASALSDRDAASNSSIRPGRRARPIWCDGSLSCASALGLNFGTAQVALDRDLVVRRAGTAFLEGSRELPDLGKSRQAPLLAPGTGVGRAASPIRRSRCAVSL